MPVDSIMNWRGFAASLIVAFVVLSVLADSGTPQLVITGTVAKFKAREWISVANEATDPIGATNPMGLWIILRDTTTYEGSPAAIKPGVRVTVWYRSVGERRPIADKVRVAPNF